MILPPQVVHYHSMAGGHCLAACSFSGAKELKYPYSFATSRTGTTTRSSRRASCLPSQARSREGRWAR
jgi:hypothetical protein